MKRPFLPQTDSLVDIYGTHEIRQLWLRSDRWTNHGRMFKGVSIQSWRGLSLKRPSILYVDSVTLKQHLS